MKHQNMWKCHYTQNRENKGGCQKEISKYIVILEPIQFSLTIHIIALHFLKSAPDLLSPNSTIVYKLEVMLC